ncbi:MAG: radical SAM protein [Sandaracinaceae bacterium]|nr:radical SAM protein [Sandaracinaceae bacterium]
MALLDVILGYDCNLACTYCTIGPAMRARALPTERVVRAMREARARGFDEVSFTGGEPTIRADLLPLVRFARHVGFSRIKLQSNGLLYATRANAARLLEAGVTAFHVSIHTHEEAAYERMVRREGTFARMRDGLANLVELGTEPVADVILEAGTVARLPDAIRWLHGLGVRHADLWSVSLTDANRDNFASMPPISDVMPHVLAALEVADALGVRVRTLHLPRCLLGARAGHAHDPAADRVRVLSPDDEFDLEDSKLTPQVHVPACDGCPERGRCRGLRPDYLERFGDAEVARARGQAPAIAPSRLAVIAPSRAAS